MSIDWQADVLVIGGGMAGAWAAITAARAGAEVVLAEKGWVGTSGVTATAGPGHWWVPPDEGRREAAIRDRDARSFGLGDRRWMARILETTWQNLPSIASHYRFSVDDHGVTQYRALRGPEYLRALRQIAEAAGVRIMDHSPALELLLHHDGSVAGARGIQRQPRGRAWTVRAAAVILATGGCAFRSHLLGSRNNTGDGYLMAAEAGASLSGMEFSTFHTVAPKRSTQTRAAPYAFGVYTDAVGRELDFGRGPDIARPLAKALLEGPVFCSLARMPEDLRARMPQIQPAVMMDFARSGIDPFRDRFEVTLHGEGTVRGTGGLEVTDDDCQTSVPGLYAAGDAASRELVAGATSGGGAQNSAWALSSGIWSGLAAARRVRNQGRREGEAAEPIGQAGLRPSRRATPLDPDRAIDRVKAEMLPYEKALFRTGAGLARSSAALDEVWSALRQGAAGAGVDVIRTREAAALAASARWCTLAALTRKESRGMHRREDAPEVNPDLAHRLVLSGLDKIRIEASADSSIAALA